MDRTFSLHFVFRCMLLAYINLFFTWQIDRYTGLTTGIKDLYNNAKAQHAKGVALLIKEFEYHPAFKIKENGFTARPFKPL